MVDSSAKKVKLHKYCSMKFCINNDSYGGHAPVSFIYKLKKQKLKALKLKNYERQRLKISMQTEHSKLYRMVTHKCKRHVNKM